MLKYVFGEQRYSYHNYNRPRIIIIFDEDDIYDAINHRKKKYLCMYILNTDLVKQLVKKKLFNRITI